MDTENCGRLGQSFLAEARVAIDALSEADGLDLETDMSLARAYARAEMEAPESLISLLLGDVGVRSGMEEVLDDLDAQLDELRGEVGEGRRHGAVPARWRRLTARIGEGESCLRLGAAMPAY